MINKIDTFLPNLFHHEIKNTLTSRNFPWYYIGNAVYPNENDGPDTYGFSHLIFSNTDDFFYKSNFFDFFYPICYFIPDEINKILRIRIGMQTKVSDTENKIDYPHIDYTYSHKTLLYYVNTSDGNTIFYDNFNSKVFENKPEENTAIIFDGKTLHSSSHPVKNNSRIAININYV